MIFSFQVSSVLTIQGFPVVGSPDRVPDFRGRAAFLIPNARDDLGVALSPNYLMPLSPPLIIEKTKEKAFPARYDETALTLSEGLQPTATLIIAQLGDQNDL
jgi:hypothetical protein